jgi:hypothetical protein
MNSIHLLMGAMLLHTSIAQAAIVASFDDLALPPDVTTSTGLQYTNTINSLIYQGISWDAAFNVVGIGTGWACQNNPYSDCRIPDITS